MAGADVRVGNCKYLLNQQTLFKNVNLQDEDAINHILQQYREIIAPAYKSFGLQNTANSNSLTNVIEQDISRFDIQIANARTVISNVGNTCDYIV